MNSKTVVFSITTILSASALFAEPRVDQSAVTLEQDSQSRLVTVGYELTGEPAVITVDFQTNTLANAAGDWVSIGDVNFTNVIGDVNQVVQTGSHAIYWQPDKSWPDQRINDGRVRAVVKAWATNAPPDYCVVCLLTDAQMEDKRSADVRTWNIPRRRYFASKEAIPGGVTNQMYKTQFLVLRKIPAAGVVWRMGQAGVTATGTETAHKVMLTKDYYMGIYEFTQGQRSAVNGTESSNAYPDGSITWDNLRGTYASYPWPQSAGHEHEVASDKVLGKLRTRTGIDSFDLPTEAQWEYGCRAGMGGWTYNLAWTSGQTKSQAKASIQAVAWVRESGNSLHEVGLKPANDWGLYDMLGNSNERTLDWFGNFTASDEVAVDPVGAASNASNNKSWRGAYYGASADWCYISLREGKSYNQNSAACGYRVVCDAVAK